MNDASNRIEDAQDIADGELRDYYEQVKDVWATMSVFDGDDTPESLIVPGTAANGKKNWYTYSSDRAHVDASAAADDDVDPGDLFAGRPYSARADQDELVDDMLGDYWDYRLPHLTINYQQRGLDDWATKVRTDDGSSNWADSNPLPGYGDIDAVALFADVDFAADEKRRPVDDGTRGRIESILRHWRDSYAGVVDDQDAVAILDSVGGTYVMLRPAVTRPICRFAAVELPAAERRALNKELQQRWRDFNSDVNDSADDWDAFAQDADTNKNRLFKAPLAVHKRLPGVVTPVDTDDIAFTFTHWDDVDDGLIEDTRDWAQWFTQPEPEKADDWAGALLDTLFDDVDADSWRSDLEDWADDREQADTTAQANALEDTDVDPSELAGDVTFVSQRGDVWDAIDDIDCESVADELNVISSSDRQESDDATRIEVNWRRSGSGDSAMVRSDIFTDMDGMESDGGPATLVAYNLIGGDTHKPANWRDNPDHIQTVIDWFIGSQFDVPIYIPEKGSTYTTDGETRTHSRTPNWALRRVAELLDIAPDTAFDDETDACIVPSLHNRILDVLDDADVDHNRDRKDVRVDATGEDTQARERGVDVEQVIADSPADIPADGAAGAADAPTDGDDSSRTDSDTTTATQSTASDDAPTWAARYGIPERDSVDDVTMTVDVPGVAMQWVELADGRAGWGWQDTYRDDDGNEQVGYDFVLNADLELLSRLDYPERREQQTEWRVRINPTAEGEPQREITLTPAAFNSSRELRDELIGKTESVVFNPQGKGAKAVNELKQLLHAQDAPRRKAHEKVELIETDDGAAFVTPEGTVNADGWIDDPMHVFEGVADGVQGDWRAAPDVVDESDEGLVADVCELLPRIRDDREQWLSMLGYTFASSLRPILFNQPASRVNTWNLLHVSGKSGAGKSAVAKTLMGALGMNAKSTTGAEKTSHAQEHMFSATNGMPVAMDEYNPQKWANWKADAFHEHLKKSTDAQSIEKGNPDQSLTEYRFEVSPIVLGEQQLPESMPALPRRAVEVTLQTLSTERGTDTAERFNDLRSLSDDDWGLGLHHHALDWWAHVCAAAESPLDVVTDWHETGDWLREELDDRDIDIDAELPRAMHQQGLQTVAFGLRRWRQFALDRGADPAHLFDDSDIVDTVEHLIDEKTGEHASSVDNEAALLELLGDAAAIRDTSGEMDTETQEYAAYGDHYTLLNVETDEPTELRLHLKSTLRQLSKFSRDYGLDATLYQKADYYRWFKSAAENPDSMILDVSRRTHLGDTQKRCVAVDVAQLTDELDVHPSDLTPAHVELEGDDTAAAGSDDDDDGDGPDYQQSPDVEPQPIEDIDAAEQVVASTVGAVEIRDWDGVDGADGRPYFTAHLVDDTGDAKLVIWDEQDMPAILDEDGTVAPDALLVRNATPDTYEGDVQLIAQSDTVIQPAQVGAGETQLPDAGENERLASTDGGATLAAADDVETGAAGDGDPGDDLPSNDAPDDGDGTADRDTDAATDAVELTTEDIDDEIRQLTAANNSGDGAARDAVATAVADRLDVDVGRVDSRIEKLLQQGRGIYEPLDDTLQPT